MEVEAWYSHEQQGKLAFEAQLQQSQAELRELQTSLERHQSTREEHLSDMQVQGQALMRQLEAL